MASNRPTIPPPRSRFTEGSMNDRVSAAPPTHFLGEERPMTRARRDPSSPSLSSSAESATGSATSVPTDFGFGVSHGQCNDDEETDRPRSASAAFTAAPKEKRGFFAPLWTGLREKFIGKKQPRPMSLDAGTAAAAAAARASARQPFAAPAGPTQPITINGVNLPGGVGKERPTREEVMASYHQLLDSGFFGAHAIKSTRHPGAGASEGLLSTSLPSQRPGGPPTEFSPTSFSRPQLPTIYSPARTRMAPPDSPHKTPQKSPSRRPLTATTPERPTTAPTPESRGKKRAHDEREDEEAATPRPTRKLRKTTRSIADFALPRIKRYRATESAQSPPAPAPMRPLAAVGGARSPEASGFGLSAIDSQSIVKSVGGVLVRRSFSGSSQTNKLAKRPASSSGGGSRPGSSRVPTRELTISGPVSSVVKLEPGRFDALQSGQATDIESLGGKVIATGVPWGRLAQQQQEELERMQQQQQQQAGGQGVSPIQQQQGRRRNGPLSVRPDANRGIPSVPTIPAQFKSPLQRNPVLRARGENEDVEMTFYIDH